MTAAPAMASPAGTGRKAAQIRLAGSLVFFTVGFFGWFFKMKRSGSADDTLLPFSILQMLYPLLGVLSVCWILRAYGSRFPKIMVRSPSSLIFLAGTFCIMAGGALHIKGGQYTKDAVLFEVRWLLPYCFIAFLYVARKFDVPYRPIVWGLFLGACASAIGTELFRRGLPMPIDKNGDRYGGFLSHPNQYGIVASTSATMLAVFIFSRNRVRSLIGLAMIGVYSLCLFQSLSKTNIVLIVISGLASAFLISLPNLRLAGRRLFYALAALALLVVAGAFGVKILEEVSPREAKIITNAIFDPGGTKSLDDREGVFEEVFEILSRQPVTGLGPGLSDATLMHHHAHNLFLQHWIDAGISGFIGIWLITLAVFWRAFELFRRALRAPARLSEDASIRVLAGLAGVMSIFANSMSASLTTSVMTAFVIFVGIAFVREPDPTMP